MAAGRSLLFAFSLSTALACGGDTGPSVADTRVSSTTTIAASATLPPLASPTATPLAQGGEPLSFQSFDGAVTLKGRLHSIPGPQRKLVILVHEFDGQVREPPPATPGPPSSFYMNTYARELAAPGLSVLTYDLRGFGESGGPKDIEKNVSDLEVAVRFMQSRGFPQIYIVGAGTSGTDALQVAARQELAGVVTLSGATARRPPVDLLPDLPKIAEPKLFIASRDDVGAANAITDTLLPLSPEPKQSRIFDGAAHGAEMLQGANGPAVKQLILEFLNR